MQPSTFLFANPAKLNEISLDRANHFHSQCFNNVSFHKNPNINYHLNVNPPNYLSLNVPKLTPDNRNLKLRCEGGQPYLTGLIEPMKIAPSGNVSPSSQNSSKGYKSATSSYYHYTPEDGADNCEISGENFNLQQNGYHLLTDFLRANTNVTRSNNSASRDATLVDADRTLPEVVVQTTISRKLLLQPFSASTKFTFEFPREEQCKDNYDSNKTKNNTAHQHPRPNYFKPVNWDNCASKSSDCIGLPKISLENATTSIVKPSPMFPSNMAHFESRGSSFIPTFNQANQFANVQNLGFEGPKLGEEAKVLNNQLYANLTDKNTKLEGQIPHQQNYYQRVQHFPNNYKKAINLKRRTVSVERRPHALSEKENKSQTPSIDFNSGFIGNKPYESGNQIEGERNTLTSRMEKSPSITSNLTGLSGGIHPNDIFFRPNKNERDRPTLITFSPSKRNLTSLNDQVAYQKIHTAAPGSVHFQRGMGDRKSYKSSYETDSRISEKLSYKSEIAVRETEIWQPMVPTLNTSSRKLFSDRPTDGLLQQRASTTICDSDESESIVDNVFSNELTNQQMPYPALNLLRDRQNIGQLKRHKAKSTYGGGGYTAQGKERQCRDALGDISLPYVIDSNHFETINGLHAGLNLNNTNDPTLVTNIDFERVKLFYTSSHNGTHIVHVCPRLVQLYTSFTCTNNNNKCLVEDDPESRNGTCDMPAENDHAFKVIPNFKMRKSLRLKFADNHIDQIRRNNQNRATSFSQGGIVDDKTDCNIKEIYKPFLQRWKYKFSGIALILASDVINSKHGQQISVSPTKPKLSKSKVSKERPSTDPPTAPDARGQEFYRDLSSLHTKILPNLDFEYLTSSSKLFKIPCSALASLPYASTNQYRSKEPSVRSVVQRLSLVIAEPGTGFLLWKADLINFERYVKPSASTANNLTTNSPAKKSFVKYTARSGIKEYVKTHTLNSPVANNQSNIGSADLNPIYHVITKKCVATSGEKYTNDANNSPSTNKIALGFQGDPMVADQFARTICECLQGQAHKLRTVVEKSNLSNSSRNDKTAPITDKGERSINQSALDAPIQSANIYKRTYSCRFLNNKSNRTRTTLSTNNKAVASLSNESPKDNPDMLKNTINHDNKKTNGTKKRSYSLDNIHRINLGTTSGATNCIKTNPHIVTDQKSKFITPPVGTITSTVFDAKEMSDELRHKSPLQKDENSLTNCESKRFYPATLFNSLKIFGKAKNSLTTALRARNKKRPTPLKKRTNLDTKEYEPGHRVSNPKPTISLPCQFQHLTTIKQSDFENYYSLTHLVRISNNGYD